MPNHNILLFFAIIILGGCQRYSEYKKTPQGSIIITPHGIKIKDLKVIRWKVGRNYKNEVSKGIKFHFILPLLKKEYLQDLTTMDVDSWIVKISRKRIISSKHLDYFTIPLLIPQKQIMGSRDFKPMRSGRVNIFYASSFVRLDNSTSACPRLGHRKVIPKIKIKKQKSLDKSLYVSFVNESSLRVTSQYTGYEPEKINGGMSLHGTYIIELALYSAKHKKLRSNWFLVNEAIVIDTEKEVNLLGCSFYDRTAPLR